MGLGRRTARRASGGPLSSSGTDPGGLRSGLDAGLAAALAAAASAELVFGAVDGPLAVAVPASLAATLALAWRVTAPRTSFVVVALSVAALSASGVTLSSIALLCAMLVAAYSPARHCDTRPAVGLAVAALAVQGLALTGLRSASPSDLVFEVVLIGAPFLAGSALRSRALYAAALADRAVLLERERDERARTAVAEERSRIARELHDVIGHNLSVAIIQTVAASGWVEDGSTGAAHLTAVEHSCRQALDEMRRLLDVLGPDGDEVPLTPVTGLSGVATLVSGVRQAGLPVELTIEGDAEELPAGLDLALYRVAQEALTNALRHCGGALTRLTVRYGPEQVEIDVVDDGPRRPAPVGAGAGRGLIGMHERMALYGGTLSAAPRSEGGFRVHACAPLPGGPA